MVIWECISQIAKANKATSERWHQFHLHIMTYNSALRAAHSI